MYGFVLLNVLLAHSKYLSLCQQNNPNLWDLNLASLWPCISCSQKRMAGYSPLLSTLPSSALSGDRVRQQHFLSNARCSNAAQRRQSSLPNLHSHTASVLVAQTAVHLWGFLVWLKTALFWSLALVLVQMPRRRWEHLFSNSSVLGQLTLMEEQCMPLGISNFQLTNFTTKLSS